MPVFCFLYATESQRASHSTAPSRNPHGDELQLTINQLSTARPTAQIVPFRAAAVASISSSSRKDATGAIAPAGAQHGIARRERREVPLPSQEGTKGAVQYALYVTRSEGSTNSTSALDIRTRIYPLCPLHNNTSNKDMPLTNTHSNIAQPSTASSTGPANPLSGP